MDFKLQEMMWQVLAVVLYTVLTVDHAAALERLCGRRLADAVSLVCAGRGVNNPSLAESKRRDESYDQLPIPRTFDLKSLYKMREEASGADDDWHLRRKRSIVEDCCFRTCSISELRQYCAPGAGQPFPDIIFGPSKVVQSQGNPGQGGSQPGQSGGIRNPSAFRQKFQGIWNKPFFFVTPARRDGLIDASERD